ncbi:hypothetical protein [Jatrophihabitans sp.]|uniref:hypothetical protein n=1 Tax=Jatrophihabitans sp. TaxID=1932789 RepID=UPI002CE55774|nr:hypothetical protein [Jatrophihabitans sp.]
MWKRIALAGTAAAVMAGAGVVSAAPASAGTSSGYYISNPKGQPDSGYGEFDDLGEHFYACDLRVDGYGVQIDWYEVVNPGNHGSLRDVNGANGDCATYNASIAEGHAVNWRICNTDAGTEVSCTGYLRDYA